MLMLSSVLTAEGTPLHIRGAAGIALKNALSARVGLPQPCQKKRCFYLDVGDF